MQIVWLHPTKIAASPANPVTVKNLTGGTVYYRADQFVSSATNDGSITEGSEHEFTEPAFIITATNEVAEVRVFNSLSVASPGRRLIEAVQSTLKEGEAVGTYLFPAGNTQILKATALAAELAEQTFSMFWYDPALYQFRGKAAQLVLEGIVTTNAVAPTSSFKFGLYKVEKLEGAEKKAKITVEAVVAASVTPTITTPAKETASHTEVTFNGGGLAAGLYTIGLELITATTALKSLENVFGNLYAYSGEA